MTHTEEEAHKCWCPFARVTDGLRDGGNRYPQLDDRTTGAFAACIGSSCMAWRWEPLKADDAFAAAIIKAAAEIGDKVESRTKATKHVMANRAKYDLPTKPFEGFCGLAGASQ